MSGAAVLPGAADVIAEVAAGGGRGLQARLLAEAVAASHSAPPAEALLPRVNMLLQAASQPPVTAER